MRIWDLLIQLKSTECFLCTSKFFDFLLLRNRVFPWIWVLWLFVQQLITRMLLFWILGQTSGKCNPLLLVLGRTDSWNWPPYCEEAQAPSGEAHVKWANLSVKALGEICSWQPAATYCQVSGKFEFGYFSFLSGSHCWCHMEQRCFQFIHF